MNENKIDKIQRLLALANDANDAESMVALAKAQQLMLEGNVTEEDIFQHKQQQEKPFVRDKIINKGKPQKWVYRLAALIAKNFRVKYYYATKGKETELHYLGVTSDVQIAEITFQYARGSISYSSKAFMRQPEIKRKYKRKWRLKQDYIEGYLTALGTVFRKQVRTSGYELALQLPEVVEIEIEKLNLESGKDFSHEVENNEVSNLAFYTGYEDGLDFKNRDLIS
ncbi:DUF2786 domain-containing protein [Enterococcus sp. AZ196]|uniref:DUF2786 domain-containing protein n=1 Tax=Enterococcus sp. AZ196 TaxID=2774659 RepID=UPI003D280766